MNDLPLGLLFGALVLLIVLSACFSATETAMMALNRYRLRHLVRAGHPGAIRAERLLERPDRLIGLVLLGNNFVNILASSIATLVALRLWGNEGIAVAAGVLTVVVLVFGEVMPKTAAAANPERIALPAAWVLGPLLTALWPLVWLLNMAANALLRLVGLDAARGQGQRLSRDELRTLLYEGVALGGARDRSMLLRVMDLDRVTVGDVMVPRGDIEGIDLDEDHELVLARLTHLPHTRVPVYRGTLDRVEGILNARRIAHLAADPQRMLAALPNVLAEPYFVPESTPLTHQLRKFQDQSRRLALVVDEYGETTGLITVEDILREIVGELGEQSAPVAVEVRAQPDGSWLADGSVNLRDLARATGWDLPGEGARTLNGALLEHLQDMPVPGTGVLLGDHPVEIVQVSGNAVRLARVHPPRRGATGRATD